MQIFDHPSPNHSVRKAGVRVDTVLIHHTATNGEYAARDWLCRQGSGVSAHYLISRGGVIWRLVPEDRKAWHAGNGRLPWETCPEYDFNHRSIGIEVVNPGDGVTPFTEAQYRALEWLVPDVIQRLEGPGVVRAGAPHVPVRFHDPCVWVLGHRDVAPGRKTDPADNFDWGRIRQALQVAV